MILLLLSSWEIFFIISLMLNNKNSASTSVLFSLNLKWKKWFCSAKYKTKIRNHEITLAKLLVLENKQAKHSINNEPGNFN